MLSKFVKNIFRSKKAKKVCCVFIFCVVCYFAFSIWADCFAEGAVMDSQTRITNFNVMASEIIKCVYVLLWPLIFVCGVALDNSLVYGTWLHLDAPLWSFWNIMKNISNFALWWLVLFAILRNLLSAVWKWWGDKWSPLNVISKTLVAGILIQMSWFLVAAVIDVSTVLTYAVWWLPMTVLKSNPNYSNRPVMSLSINAWSDVNGLNANIYYTYGDHRVSDCLIRDDLSISWSYIVWPKIMYLWNSYDSTWFYMDTGYCTIGWWPYRYNHLMTWDGAWIYPVFQDFDTETWVLRNWLYTTSLKSNIDNLTSDDLESVLSDCVIIPVDDLKLWDWCKNQRYWPLSLSGDDEFFRWANSDNTILYTVDNLIEKSKWFVWPMITIYSSLLDVQSFVEDGGTQYVETFISLLFKLVFMIVLVAPLVWLAVVLVVRVWVLRVLIAAAPALILIWVFGDMLGSLKEILWKTFALWNVVKLIFAPVIITLAISLSLIFINAISGIIKWDGAQRKEVFETLWIQTDPENTNNYSILGLIDIELDTTLIGKWKDDFAYFITFLFATAIIRFFLVAALKMCGTIWESVWGFIDKNFTKMVKNIPIVPLPGGNGAVGLEALSEVPQRLTNKVVNEMKQKSEENMELSFPWLYSYEWKQTLAENVVEKIGKNEITSLTSAQVSLLAPIFGTNNGSQIVERVKAMWSDDAKSLVNNYYTYRSETYTENLNNIAKEWAKIWATKTSADALKLTKSELNIAVQNDATWISRAEGMIWWAVHTQDGVYIVDIIPWTEQNPMYRIVDRDTYELDHFGKPIANVSEEEFETRKSENQQNLTEYLGKLSDSDKKLAELEKKDKESRTEDETKQMDQLNGFFTENIRELLDNLGLSDHKFKKQKEGEQWQSN